VRWRRGGISDQHPRVRQLRIDHLNESELHAARYAVCFEAVVLSLRESRADFASASDSTAAMKGEQVIKNRLRSLVSGFAFAAVGILWMSAGWGHRTQAKPKQSP